MISKCYHVRITHCLNYITLLPTISIEESISEYGKIILLATVNYWFNPYVVHQINKNRRNIYLLAFIPLNTCD